MCGLVGMIGNICNDEKKMFRDMLVFDQVRGFDSTGVVSVPTNKHEKLADENGVILDKDIGAAQNLWEYDTANLYNLRGVINHTTKVLIGHNRAATLGQVTVENAHPFNFGHVYGAHNGSLVHWSGLEDAAKFDVDSMAIFKDIEVNGIENTWKSFIGAAALTWWDAEEETMNIIKNDERPLYFAYSEKGDVLFWASELWMITVAASRNKVKLRKKDKVTDWIEPTVDTHYKFNVTATNFSLAEEKKLEKKSWSSYQTTNSGSCNGHNTTGTTGYANTPFVAVQGWKAYSKRCKLSRKDLSFASPRSLSLYSQSTRRIENFVRVDLFRNQGNQIVFAGVLDILPRNVTEYNNLRKLVSAFIGNKKFKIALKNNPRLADSKVAIRTDRYLCSYSSIEFSVEGEEDNKVIPFGVPDKKEQPFNVINNKKDDFELLFSDYDGSMVNQADITKRLKFAGDCCAMCGNVVEPEDVNSGNWLSKVEFICETCTQDWNGDMGRIFGYNTESYGKC